jgi:hypothetical protein
MRSTRVLLVLSGIAVLLIGLFFSLPRLLDGPGSGGPVPESLSLSDRDFHEVQEIHIKNQYDDYYARWQDGAFVLADLPAAQLNDEYVQMLLDESSRVEYLSLVSAGETNPGQYGLADPQAEVDIRYSDGETLSFSVGAEEKISAGRYLRVKDRDDILIMDNSRAIRFIMPLTGYINYVIVPFTAFQSPLSSVKQVTLSGKAFPRPVVIEAVDAENKAAMRDAASFGVATHLIRSPVLHEIDQKECIEVFASLTGLLNKDVLAYNCTGEELAAFGFNDPWVKAEFDFQLDKDAAVEHIVLRAARYEDGYILVRDDQSVVHRIENEAFIETKYEKLAMRWFLTPFITDLRSLELSLDTVEGERAKPYHGAGEYLFEFSGDSNSTLGVSLNGKALNIALFRKFYSLLISAANDGVLLEQPARKTTRLMGLRFMYKDEQKPPDVMNLYEGELRRINVEVNGITEFAMLRRYIDVVSRGLAALIQGNDFAVDW